MKLLIALSLALFTAFVHAESPLYSIPLKDIDGKDTSLKAHAGKVLLIVNVASECGATQQYAGLQALWSKLKDKGLVVLGMPCNDFGGQEPGDEAAIKAFVREGFAVDFPMFSKLGIQQNPHPLYQELTKTGKVGWNFTKFLVGKDGAVIAKFDTDVEPESPELTAAIEKALK
jgi:glutathione peroxidase